MRNSSDFSRALTAGSKECSSWSSSGSSYIGAVLYVCLGSFGFLPPWRGRSACTHAGWGVTSEKSNALEMTNDTGPDRHKVIVSVFGTYPPSGRRTGHPPPQRGEEAEPTTNDPSAVVLNELVQ